MTPMKLLWDSWEMFARGRGLITYIRSSTALGRRLDVRFPQKGQRRCPLPTGVTHKGFGASVLSILSGASGAN